MNADPTANPNHPLAISVESDGYDCPLCLEHLHTAHAASCGHIFCGRCITILQKTNSTCPFRCPQTNLAPTNLPQINRMLEVNDHRIAKLIHSEDQIQQLSHKIDMLANLLTEQTRIQQELQQSLQRYQQPPTCCLARCLWQISQILQHNH